VFRCLGLEDWILGLRFESGGKGLGAWCLVSRVWCLECEVLGLMLGVEVCGCRVQVGKFGSVLRFEVLGFRVEGLGLRGNR